MANIRGEMAALVAAISPLMFAISLPYHMLARSSCYGPVYFDCQTCTDLSELPETL